MRVGIVLLPELDWAEDRQRWQRAEEHGFDHAWTFDHLAWRSLAGGPWHATIPTLVAAALATTRIRLGTLVTSPNFRHPVPLAKDLMTLDVISDGRLSVALGAGGPGFDAAVLGGPALTPAQRFDRFAEFRELLDLLLSQQRTTWSGAYFQAVDARMIPGPRQQPRPPLLIAANGPRAMRLAASSARRPGDGWVTLGPAEATTEAEWWTGVAATGARMDDLLAGVGGAPDGFVRLLDAESFRVTGADHARHLLGRSAELGYTDVVISWPRSSEPFAGSEAVLDAVAEVLAERAS
ncbi:LLM class flavin-dependent oxidoreductase [Petropleomorpha daqingensis]|uniref:Alkanesulfonate monooxygenase SsuD/methylene tetrahydromethanopterin reductase-like flavin-dependent oxidoreductase (Luciferase family) n=1 Tax=Petropleomorpha daqingensis TaxID=2026353 RepID=A0A853CLT8_9ACTN|nr:LLM class flavin-dependent oxidoreductase [Petropleomorpha daqingensis]NYJ07228.1 alkanesulfonate monooxygenase SsuD/methylene tetrahydromethanopterin reductase-like flavin-dependent oxidoreductase (luciferase family) [Petropleomorpha daqingensis]